MKQVLIHDTRPLAKEGAGLTGRSFGPISVWQVLQDQSSDHFVISLFIDCGDMILPLIGPMRLAISRNDTLCLLS